MTDQWLAPWRLEQALVANQDISDLVPKLPLDYVLPGPLTTKLLRNTTSQGTKSLIEQLTPFMVVTVAQALEMGQFPILRRAIELEGAKSKAVFTALCSRLVLTEALFFEEICEWLLSEAVVADLSSRLGEMAGSSRASFSDALYEAVRNTAETFPGFLVARFHAVNPGKTFAFFESLIDRSVISGNSLTALWERVRKLHVYRPREDADGRMKRRLLDSLENSRSTDLWLTLFAVDPAVVLGSESCRKFLEENSDQRFLGEVAEFLVKKGTLTEYLGNFAEISDHFNLAIGKVAMGFNGGLLRLCLRRRWWRTLQAVIGNCLVEISRVQEALEVFTEILDQNPEIGACKIAIGNFFALQLQPWLPEISSREISERVSRLLDSVEKNFRSQACAVKLLMIGNFLAFSAVPEPEICRKFLDVATESVEGLEILTKNSACLRFLALVADGDNFQKISDHAKAKFPRNLLPDKMRSEISPEISMEVEQVRDGFDATRVLQAVQTEIGNSENFQSLWTPLIFSVNGRSLACDGLFRGRNFQEISDFVDEVIAAEISMSSLYALTVALETTMKKSLGSKRVGKILTWLESGNFHSHFHVMSRPLSALAMAARDQPHLRVCEKLLEISSCLVEEKNFQTAYWCSYVALISGRDRTGAEEPWWISRSEKVLRNFRSFAAHPEAVPFLLRLIETVSGNLSPQTSMFLAAPLILDIVMLFPCAQENELKSVVFTLLSSVGHAGAKNINAVCDQRHRDILKALIDEYNLRHKFRGKV